MKQDSGIEVFQIGHDKSKSETFLPSVAELTMPDTNQQYYFADLAGISDTGGDLIDLVNSMVAKFIFMQAKDIKFLMPITHQ